MELPQLIEGLSDSQAYPFATTTIEVRQTHISVVFLAGPFAYKIKKPLNLGFLDFTTLEKRRYFCEEEVRLNNRLAPGVYFGVVAVTLNGARVEIDSSADGVVIEWAVKMVRLPDEATLKANLARGAVNDSLVSVLARKIAAFHAASESGPHISTYADFDVVADNARENLRQATGQVGVVMSQTVHDRLKALVENALCHHHDLFEKRAETDIPRDTHGDLRLEHVYFFPEKKSPDDIIVVDCIEFSRQFRFADPVADMAFLVMDFKFHRRADLARKFTDSYFCARNDEEGCALLPFYTSYRAAVRAKVQGVKMSESEVSDIQREAALASARAHWLLALAELEEPKSRPCLVLIGGLPGTGKSTLAVGLAQEAKFKVIRSDAIRKELTGTSGSAVTPFEEGIYTPDWTERTYCECLTRTETLLFEGQRVIVDASFADDKKRRAFFELAARWSVPVIFFLCQAERLEVHRRLVARRDDPSDADWAIYKALIDEWQEPNRSMQAVVRPLRNVGTRSQLIDQALSVLGELELFG